MFWQELESESEHLLYWQELESESEHLLCWQELESESEHLLCWQELESESEQLRTQLDALRCQQQQTCASEDQLRAALREKDQQLQESGRQLETR